MEHHDSLDTLSSDAQEGLLDIDDNVPFLFDANNLQIAADYQDEKFDAKRIVFLLLTVFPEAVADPMLYPLFPYMVRHFFKVSADNPINVGYYTGILGSAFFLPLLVTNILWGKLSDRYGRRRILLTNLCFTFMSVFALAFAESFWVVVVARVVAGIFGANSTVVKGALGEIHQKPENRGAGFAMYSGLYGITGILGPLVGGALMQLSASLVGESPSDFYGGSKPIDLTNASWIKSVLVRWPYLFPCLFAVFVHGLGFVSVIFWVKEPSPVREAVIEIDPSLDSEYEHQPLQQSQKSLSFSYITNFLFNTNSRDTTAYRPLMSTDTSTESIELTESQQLRLKKNLPSSSNHPGGHIESWGPAFTYRTLYGIGLYCLIAGLNMIYSTALPLYFSAPRPIQTQSPGALLVRQSSSAATKKLEMTGLGLTPSECSYVIMIASISKLLSQGPVHKMIHSWMGVRRCYQYGMAIFVPLMLLIPTLSYLEPFAKAHPSENTDSLPAKFWTFLGFILASVGLVECMSYLSVMLIITDASLHAHSESSKRKQSDGNDEEDERAQLGLTHGLASTCAAFIRTITPNIAGWLWEFGTLFNVATPNSTYFDSSYGEVVGGIAKGRWIVWVFAAGVAGFGCVVVSKRVYDYFVKEDRVLEAGDDEVDI